MGYIETAHPEAVVVFKEVLAKPFIPERRVVQMDRYGNPKKVVNPEGFLTPGKTYRRGVKGKAFYNLMGYAQDVHRYFSKKK